MIDIDSGKPFHIVLPLNVGNICFYDTNEMLWNIFANNFVLQFQELNTATEYEKLTVDWSQSAKKLTVFIPFQKRGHEKWQNRDLEQLRAERNKVETQLAQEQHKLERLENRKKYLEKGERQKRTHRLCNLGGTIESLAPEVKDLNRAEMTELMEHIFSLSEVQRAVRHMAITHTNQANREKELKADGTISSERHAD